MKKNKKDRKKRDKGLHKNTKTDHHIIPSSRGGNDSKHNIAIVPNRLHQKYHHLFINMTPDEIIKYLVEVYWNNQWKWVEIALNEKKWEDKE